MEDKIIFKTAAVGGFEKKAVTDYIYQMNEQHDYVQQQLKNENNLQKLTISELEQTNQKLEARVSMLEKEVSNTAKRASNKDHKQEKLSTLSDALSQEVEDLQQALSEKEQALSAAETKTKELQERYRDLEEKRDELERATIQVGRVLVEARTDAEEVIELATSDALNIRARADKEAETVVAAAKAELEAEFATRQQKADEIIREAQAEAEEILTDARDLSEATVFASEERAKTIIENTQARVAAMISVGNDTTATTTKHLTQLKEETTAIQQTVAKAFEHILEQASFLGEAIADAEEVMISTQDLAEELASLEVEALSQEDVLAIKKKMKQHSKEQSDASLAAQDTEIQSLELQENPEQLSEEPSATVSPDKVNTKEADEFMMDPILNDVEELNLDDIQELKLDDTPETETLEGGACSDDGVCSLEPAAPAAPSCNDGVCTLGGEAETTSTEEFTLPALSDLFAEDDSEFTPTSSDKK